MNKKTLIPNSKRTPEELSAMGKKGGIASGKKRRELRSAREILNMLLERPLNTDSYSTGSQVYTSRELREIGIPEDKQSQKIAMMYELMEKATHGDVKAIGLVLKITGEYPTGDGQSNDSQSDEDDAGEVLATEAE